MNQNSLFLALCYMKGVLLYIQTQAFNYFEFGISIQKHEYYLIRYMINLHCTIKTITFISWYFDFIMNKINININ